MDSIREKKAFICDMDGVIYHDNRLLPGARRFVRWLKDEEKRYVFLTNNSQSTPEQLSRKLRNLGIEAAEQHFYTSAQATAAFLDSYGGGTAYVIGGNGTTRALSAAGIEVTDTSPDWVVVGETDSYDYESIRRAVTLVRGGARLIGTNPDMTGPGGDGVVPATGALISPVELAAEKEAYFVGKPNPLMMRHALKKLGCRREDTVIIGDRMDTDIVAGVEAEIQTVLVLSGVTAREDLPDYAYRPQRVVEHVGQLVP